MLPNFLVVGVQKSGTTSLYQYLRAHPDIYLPEQKETKFFVNDKIYANGLNYYKQEFFSSWEGESAIGEVDPDYMYFHQGLPRISKDLDIGALKLVFVFRNPVDRAFSHYMMTYRRGVERLSFEEALEAEPERICQSYLNRMHYSYFDRGLYAEQLERFLEVVDISQMHFMLSDRLAVDPKTEVDGCLRFLGVDTETFPEIEFDQFHRATVPRSPDLLYWLSKEGWPKHVVRKLLPKEIRWGLKAKMIAWNEKPAGEAKMSASIRTELLNRYARDIFELEKITGMNLAHWRAEDGD